jgi:protoporphyrinogen oxidase
VARCIVIGAGPAGLTAAHALAERGAMPMVVEADDAIGGISRTVQHRGYRFDIGGHRFFTKIPAVRRFWEEQLGEEFLVRPRLSRIYYAGRFFDYPLNPWNALRGLGPIEAVRIVASYLRAQIHRDRDERTFEQWVTNRFGRRLFEIFFESYTEKIWGIPCSEIDADWAAQRIKNLDVSVLIKNALLGPAARARGQRVTSLIDRFHYPRHGPGQLWEACAERLGKRGVEVRTRARVERICHDGRRVHAVTLRHSDSRVEEIETDGCISSMPLRELVHALDPALPKDVLRAADQLRYRDFLTVGLVIDREEVFPDNWIYVHSSEVNVGRIQNFKNWSPDMVPDTAKTSLGLEYFVQENDELWCADDEELVALASRECAALGLIDEAEVCDGVVIRMPKAYPVYDGSYREALATIRDGLAPLSNLYCVGRNGQHRYNNQDHSMLTGMLAAENFVSGSAHDIWDVNVEAEYHEEARQDRSIGGDPLVPGQAPPETLEDAMRRAFARYDPNALGAAIGSVAGLGLFLATAFLLLRGGEVVGPNLSLLGNYFLGFEVSWPGAFLGLAEAGLLGGAAGFVLGHLLNGAIGIEERSLQRRVDALSAMNPFGADGG